MTILTNAVNYEPGKPRVFLAFEDRSRDLSGLLEFGTVLQIFPGKQAWQTTTDTAPQVYQALRNFFRTHDFTDQDFVVALGDPVAIALLVLAAAAENGGRVQVLRWDRLPCLTCGTFRRTCNRPDCPREIRGRYAPVALRGLAY
jgi:hypothetical protein